MKKNICSTSGCRKLGTVKYRGYHFCEECSRYMRRKKLTRFFHERLVTFFGFAAYTDDLYKLK